MHRTDNSGIRLLVRETLSRQHQDFLLEREFDAIFEGLNMLLESGKWTGPNTYEWEPESKKGTPDQPAPTFTWDLTSQSPGFAEETASKVRAFLEKLPKEKIGEYFVKFLDKVKSLPSAMRRKLLTVVGGAFLAVASLSSLTSPSQPNIDTAMAKEFRQAVTDPENKAPEHSNAQGSEAKPAGKKARAATTKKSSFSKAQKHVKVSEAGYSDDRHDSGNWVEIKGYGKRFVGSKYGISAPILAKYLGRAPKKEDMMKLSYETALKIYKKDYWDKNNLDRFSNQSVANILYDGCVNQGSTGTRETLRNAMSRLGVKISASDDPFSMQWIKVANSLDQKSLFSNIKAERASRYKSSDTFAVHGKGWLNRLGSIDFDPSV